MNSVICVICGAKKDSANKWWVLFEGGPGRAVVIGPIEEAQNLSQWQQGMARSHLCGAECLYRKLHGTLHPPVAATNQKLLQTASHDDGTESGANADAAAKGSEGGHRHLPIPLRGLLRRVTDPQGTGSEPTSSQNQKNKLRQIAAINEGVTILGQIQSDEPLYFNGELTGTLELPNHRLTVGPNAKLKAAIRAREVELLGMIEGEVRAEKIVVRKNATLLGNICTVVLVIEEGAVFDGKCSKASARDASASKRAGEATKGMS